MHPALWELIRLYRRASSRQLFRGARTVRGALVLLLLIGGTVLWLGTVVFMTFSMRGQPEILTFAGKAGPYVPILLLWLFLQSVLGNGEMHLYYSPAEVDFLFAGPFHRRELLLFKLVRKGMGLVAGSFFLSLTPILHLFHDWLSLFVGMVLAFAFINLSSMAAVLARLIVAEVAQTRVRRAVLVAVGILVAVALPRTLAGARNLDAGNLAASFRSTWPGRVLLAPVEVFSNAMLAERWFPDLLGWASAGAAIDLALLALVLKLDADYIEWSASISQWHYELTQRARRGGGMAVARSGRRARMVVPTLPWLGGAGPIAWRQLVQSGRTARGMFGITLMFTVLILALTWISARHTGGDMPMAPIAIGLFSYLSLLYTALPVAFRGDVDHLDFLKTLPVGPMAMAVGEVAGAAVLLAILQFVVAAICWAATGTGGWLLVATAILAMPADMVLLATTNLVFLLYPSRSTTQAAFDLNALGRGLIGIFIQGAILLPLFGIAGGLGAAVYLAGGLSVAGGAAAAAVVLVVELVPLLAMVAWAFVRFDPATETPR